MSLKQYVVAAFRVHENLTSFKSHVFWDTPKLK